MGYYSPEGARHEESFINHNFVRRPFRHAAEHHELEQEIPMKPEKTKPTLWVSLPVTITTEGQYGRQETYTVQMQISVDGDTFTLESPSTTNRRIEISKSGLEAALKIREEYNG